MNNLSSLLTRLRELESKATKGPFLVCRVRDGLRIESDSKEYVNDGWVPVSLMEGPDNEANAAFIAESRNALPTLLQVIEIYREALINIEKEGHKGDGTTTELTMHNLAEDAIADAEKLMEGK